MAGIETSLLTFGGARKHIYGLMDNAQIQLAIFDLGNVFFDFTFDRAVRYWAKAAGVDESVVAERLVFGKDAEDYESGLISSDEYFAGLKEKLGIPISTEDLIAGWNSIFGSIIAPSYEAITHIRGKCRVVALSNTDQSHDPVWRQKFSDKLRVFEKIYTSWSLNMMKPERRIFEHVLKAEGVAAGNAVFFDDVEENIRSARAVGMEAVHVTSPSSVSDWLRQREDLL
ncbi:MAG: hypothetical protein C0404_10260 [Verrucomicrobia bacterium]|nr:hypothetical protein [Verrucomicrobiota bacterium]